jgi:integrase
MSKSLQLYRRHTKHCVKGYPQNQRTFPPRTPAERRTDCQCPIVASGSLRLEPRRILHLSTETNQWDRALAYAAQWETWEALTDPAPAPVPEEHILITEAASRWIRLKGPLGENIGSAALRKYSVMLEQRIIPFCADHNIQFIGAFDNATVVTDCFLSFRNLNPHHNRKGPASPATGVPLSDAMKRAELERFRGFLRFCMDQGWLKNNHAKKIKLGRGSPSAKYGLTPAEESQVWDAIELVTNRGQLDQYNSRELRALCLVMRYAGLRISDAVALDHTQLVKREHGDGWAIKIMSQQKTKEWVRVPITREVVDALHGLNFKGERDGRKFWFYTGNGERDTAVNNWRERMSNLFKLAQLDKPFAHPASSHTWRHTFSISMLNSGVDIKMVSRWLGHSSTRVTEAHYGHANAATHVASELAYDAALRQGEAPVGRTPARVISKLIQFRSTRTPHAKTN